MLSRSLFVTLSRICPLKNTFCFHSTEVATACVVLNRCFLKISLNLQENICVGVSFLIKLQASGLLKKTPTQVFLVNFVKSLRAPFLQNISGLLLLTVAVLHSVHPPFLLRGLNLLPNFQKGGLDRISVFRRGLLGERG